MHEIIYTTSGTFLKIATDNFENTVPIMGDRKDPPEEFREELLANGKKWDFVQLAEAVTGIYRYTKSKGAFQGKYYTNILSWSSTDMVRRLELGSDNLAIFKQRVAIRVGWVAIGEMILSNDTQIFVSDPVSGVQVCEWTATAANFISNI